jgi:hypothetical protein
MTHLSPNKVQGHEMTVSPQVTPDAPISPAVARFGPLGDYTYARIAFNSFHGAIGKMLEERDDFDHCPQEIRDLWFAAVSSKIEDQ